MSITRATILLLLSVLSPLSAQATPELVLYNWSQYLATPLKQQFERETGYQIRELNYDSDEARNRLLLSEQPPNMDLVVVDYLTLRNPQIHNTFCHCKGLICHSLIPVPELDVEHMLFPTSGAQWELPTAATRYPGR